LQETYREIMNAIRLHPLRTLLILFASLTVFFLAYFALLRLGRLTGVSDAELQQSLPGDQLVPEPHMLADRAGIINAPPERIWPWLVQLGKDRAGWYFPAWLEFFLPKSARGLREIDPRFQYIKVGDLIPDYGPGNGQFKAMVVEAPYTIVYYSLRQPSANWNWPAVEKPLPLDIMQMSWTLTLQPIDASHTRLYIRLRAEMPGGKALSGLQLIGGGLVDWSTIELLYQGLNERVNTIQPPS
jgi:hypothetical protein